MLLQTFIKTLCALNIYDFSLPSLSDGYLSLPALFPSHYIIFLSFVILSLSLSLVFSTLSPQCFAYKITLSQSFAFHLDIYYFLGREGVVLTV
jgi:hypothetical protein